MSGLTIDEQSQVINLGKGIALLADMLKSDQFTFTKEVACKIHEAVGKDEALSALPTATSDLTRHFYHILPTQSDT